jgi:hypothetical protein
MIEDRRERAYRDLIDLQDLVDREAGALSAHHAERLRCDRGCSSCCIDGLTVFEVEAERIRRGHGALLDESEPHPAGACAFLDRAGACRVYAERPYVCRTQGLPLRWLVEDERGEIVEGRDICPLNEAGGPPIAEVAEELCWTIGSREDQLVRIAERFSGGEGRRLALRSLFRREREREAVRRGPTP